MYGEIAFEPCPAWLAGTPFEAPSAQPAPAPTAHAVATPIRAGRSRFRRLVTFPRSAAQRVSLIVPCKPRPKYHSNEGAHPSRKTRQ